MQLKKLLIVALTLAVAWCGLGIDPALAEYKMPYYIDVDLTNQTVTVYNTKDGSIARQMLCSTGLEDKTPTGTWYMPTKERDDERTEWYYMPNQYCWVKYPSKIYYAYFFHSFTFNDNDDRAINQDSVDNFGVPASHGCIRLRIEDAYFIAKNCLAGTRVRIFKSGKKDEELRALLYVSSYSQDDGITYQEFLGISPDALSYGASGDDVRELQLRLHDLGYYGKSINGRYDTDTLIAVKNVQADLGLAQSGITSVELKEVIFSEDAPVSAGNITLQEGNSGPVVKKLQTALARLGLYGGEIDSVYDADVIAAVKELQRICGYDQDGIATPEIQHLAYYEVSRLEGELGPDFQSERISEDINVGTVNFKKSKLIVREKPDTDSDAVTKLSYGDKVLVVATKGEWAQVLANNKGGFMRKKYLDIATSKNYLFQYTGNGKTVTIGYTLQQKLSGDTGGERTAFRKYYASSKYLSYLDDPVEYATINTGSDDVKLNLRAEASPDGEVLAEIPNGTRLRVLAKRDGWTRVGYDDQIGYLMNDYLEFTEGSASEVEDTTDALNEHAGEQRIYRAVVMPNRREGTVPIYKEANSDSRVITTLGGGREVWVLAVNNESGWAQVRYGEKVGYMRDKNLSFRLDVSYVLDENGQLQEYSDATA